MRRARYSEADLRGLQTRGFTWSEKTPRLGESAQHEGNARPRYGSGKRADLGGLYVRSTGEANYTRYLNWCKARQEIRDWEYEPCKFEFPIKHGTTSYTPDWGVTLLDGRIQYRELKGELKPAGATKLKRMQKYFPEHEVMVIWWNDYLAIERTLGKLIPGWEFGT